MDSNSEDVVVPVVREEIRAEAVPVETGRVRVTKRPHTRQETVDQELRKGRVEVKRVKTNLPVDAPPPVRHEGNTTIIPVVAEVLKIQKQLVVTEEIHITQTEQRESVRQNVTLRSEEAQVERLEPQPGGSKKAARRPTPRSLIKGTRRP